MQQTFRLERAPQHLFMVKSLGLGVALVNPTAMDRPKKMRVRLDKYRGRRQQVRLS